MKRTLTALSILVSATLYSPAQAQAQACVPLGTHMVNSVIASAQSDGTMPGTGFLFHGGTCTTMKFGPNPPTQCPNFTMSFPASMYTAFFAAVFSESSSNTPNNGCSFNCALGACQVRGGTALPVELLRFGIN